MRLRALVDATRSLAVLIAARLPLVRALETTANQCRHERLAKILRDVHRRVQAGDSLSESLGRYPHVFDRLYVHLTRVGEAAGVMDEVFLRIASYLEKSAALRRKIQLALVYPGIIMCVAIGATSFLLMVIVPTFAEMFADFGATLPAPTRMVVRLSDVLTERYGVVLMVLGTLVGTGLGLRKSPQGALVWDRAVLRLPLVGGLLMKNIVARFCRTLGTLLCSGVALVDALEMLSHLMGNLVVEREIADLLRRVRRGSTLNQPLQQAGVFPEMVVQMIAVGEQTAELDRMLFHAAEHYEREVDAYVESLTSIIEPVLIVIIGLLLGGILVALYLPMFEMIGVVR